MRDASEFTLATYNVFINRNLVLNQMAFAFPQRTPLTKAQTLCPRHRLVCSETRYGVTTPLRFG